MGKQYNKIIKRKRRLAYLQRKDAAQVAAVKVKTAPAAKAPAAAKPKAPAKPRTPKTVAASTPKPEPAPQISESQAPVPAT